MQKCKKHLCKYDKLLEISNIKKIKTFLFVQRLFGQLFNFFRKIDRKKPAEKTQQL